MNKNMTHKIVTSAMFSALICVATMIIKIPSPLKGYINIGDCFVLLAGWALSPLYGFISAGLGSALADVLSGYVLYAPATFIIKGTMALIVYYGCKILRKKLNGTLSQIISSVVAEVFMILGYFIFEGILYGFIPSAVNIPPNAIQGAVGLVLGCLLIKFFEKNQINL